MLLYMTVIFQIQEFHLEESYFMSVILLAF